jgi:hypothetical protein
MGKGHPVNIIVSFDKRASERLLSIGYMASAIGW